VTEATYLSSPGAPHVIVPRKSEGSTVRSVGYAPLEEAVLDESEHAAAARNAATAQARANGVTGGRTMRKPV
jgi:hypothetical protein